MTRSITQRLAPLATAGAVAVFAATVAGHHPDPSTAAESTYLAWVGGCVFGVLALSRHSAFAVVPGGLLLAVALCLPAADGTRGALAMLLLVAMVAIVTWRLVKREAALDLTDYAALALAWQCLLRSERLLAFSFEPSSLVWLLALPLTAAAAAWWFGRSRGPAEAVVLLAAVAIVTPGFGVVPVAVLVMVSALCGEGGRSWQAAAIAAAAAVVAIGRLPAAAPVLLILAAALALRGTRIGAWLPWLAALAWSLIGALGHGSPGAVGWLLVALPALILAPASTRPLALAALALALSHAPEADPGTLAAAFSLAALALPTDAGAGRIGRRVQIHWSLLLLAFVTLRAAYPWLRPPLVTGSVAELGWASVNALGWPIVLLTFFVAVLACAANGLGRTLPRWGAGLALFVFCALAAGRRPPALAEDAILLTEQMRRWRDRSPRQIRELVVDSFINRGEELRVGQPVANFILLGPGLRRRLTLHNGVETADWAARRLETHSAPSPWLHWHGGDGTLAQRYRTTWRFEEPLSVDRLALGRHPGLPAEVTVAITSLEAR